MFDATAEAGDRSNEIIQKSIEAVLHPELKHHAEPLARTIEKFKKGNCYLWGLFRISNQDRQKKSLKKFKIYLGV